MSDKIQMTEEQFIKMLNDIFCWLGTTKESAIKTAKEKGYIKKSELEIAADNFYENNEMDIVPEFCLDYVEKLEEEIERLKR